MLTFNKPIGDLIQLPNSFLPTTQKSKFIPTNPSHNMGHNILTLTIVFMYYNDKLSYYSDEAMWKIIDTVVIIHTACILIIAYVVNYFIVSTIYIVVLCL